jgi:hypothetical protein
MRFTSDNVDLPNELLEALDSNTLVVFAGAGISARAYPQQRVGTFYPLFAELVKKIAAGLDRTLSEDEVKQLDAGMADRVLGEWRYDEYEVHQEAARILQLDSAQCRTELHRAITSLLSGSATPRLITTNFDDLLAQSLREAGIENDWQIFEAPALPPPIRFRGLCHLHGRVSTPGEMVLTDRDIGRAYMDEAWALRFAHTVFREFNVLFIGYRLEDPPLRYLSLALEGQKPKRHWAFVPDQSTTRKKEAIGRDWSRRGVTPIWYPAKNSDHRALERTLRGWSEDQARTFIHKREMAIDWAMRDPRKLEQHDLERMRRFLETPEIARDVATSGFHEAWLECLSNWGIANQVLEMKGPHSEADNPIAQWIVSGLLKEPTRWLGHLQKYRGSISPLVVIAL